MNKSTRKKNMKEFVLHSSESLEIESPIEQVMIWEIENLKIKFLYWNQKFVRLLLLHSVRYTNRFSISCRKIYYLYSYSDLREREMSTTMTMLFTFGAWIVNWAACLRWFPTKYEIKQNKIWFLRYSQRYLNAMTTTK